MRINIELCEGLDTKTNFDNLLSWLLLALLILQYALVEEVLLQRFLPREFLPAWRPACTLLYTSVHFLQGDAFGCIDARSFDRGDGVESVCRKRLYFDAESSTKVDGSL